MAQNIFRSAIDDAGLSDRVRVTSRGTSSWHVGEPADNRARTELLAHGYSDAHTAAHLAPDDFDADLLVAMDSGHAKDLERKRLGARVRLLRDTGNTLCDPVTGLGVPVIDRHALGDDLDVADPYYGTQGDFALTRQQIEAAVPGMLAWVNDRLGSS